MVTIEQIWAGLPKGAKLNARALAIEVHDMCCLRCQENPYWREHCGNLARIETLGATE